MDLAAIKLKRQRRKAYFFETFAELLRTHSQILLLDADNVGSFQMQQVRIALRGRATLIMGKNTMMRKVIRQEMEANPKLERLLPLIQENVGVVFTSEDMGEIREIISDNRVPAFAKAGAIAPINVTVPAGPTGLEPTQTSHLQVLGIATKITRGAIEILAPVDLITKGEKVGSSEAVLLQKLDIKPFSYGLDLVSVYDDGTIYSAEVLDLGTDDIVGFLMEGVANVAAFSLGIGYPTAPSAPHSIIAAFKNVLNFAVGAEYEMAEAEAVFAYLADPSAFVAAAPAGGNDGGDGGEEEAAKEETDESDDDMGFSLFG